MERFIHCNHSQVNDVLAFMANPLGGDAKEGHQPRRYKNPLALTHLLRYNHKNLVPSAMKAFRMLVSWRIRIEVWLSGQETKMQQH